MNSRQTEIRHLLDIHISQIGRRLEDERKDGWKVFMRIIPESVDENGEFVGFKYRREFEQYVLFFLPGMKTFFISYLFQDLYKITQKRTKVKYY